jgi:hypothetical protein
MPVLLEEVEVKLEFSDLLRRVPITRIATPDGFVEQAKREPGIHMSGILKPLAIAAKKLKDYEQDEEMGNYPVLWALGVAWEEFVASLYPEMDYQPGGIERDGIHMTCDGISEHESGQPMIEEMKFTFTSSEKPMLDQWMKLCQGKAYCHGYGAQLVRWHQCHVRGDYKSFPPRYKRYLVEFSKQEIELNWRMFCANKALAIPESY